MQCEMTQPNYKCHSMQKDRFREQCGESTVHDDFEQSIQSACAQSCEAAGLSPTLDFLGLSSQLLACLGLASGFKLVLHLTGL